MNIFYVSICRFSNGNNNWQHAALECVDNYILRLCMCRSLESKYMCMKCVLCMDLVALSVIARLSTNQIELPPPKTSVHNKHLFLIRLKKKYANRAAPAIL